MILRQKSFFLLIYFQLIFCANSQKYNGVSFVASRDRIDKTHIQPVLNINSNSVALMPFGFIKSLDSPQIKHNTKMQWFGETKNGVVQYAKEFKKNNFKIMVKPQIWVWNGAFTGKIKMKNNDKWKELEKSYTSFILTYALAAKEIDADIFCIGTELESFVLNRPEYWMSLIKKIREVFNGKLTYASNWDEFKRVPFWKNLDIIGVDAYFPLTDKKNPDVQDFENGWKIHKPEIIKIQKEANKPIIFTEYGYRSVNYNGKRPWDSSLIEENINFQAQVNGLKAIYNQFWNEDWFLGGFIWKWFHSHEKVGGLNNNRFTPQNKPAEKLLAKFYSKKTEKK